MSKHVSRCRRPVSGFTLAELLIALAILGVIATFTIPKILQAQQNEASKALAKEVVATISGSYSAYKLNNALQGNTPNGAFTPYMNYVAVTTITTLDDIPGGNSMYDCSDGSTVCLKLHNGGVLLYNSGHNFGGTATTNATYFLFDPDGKRGTSGTADAPGKSIIFFIYYNGRITSYGRRVTGTANNITTWGAPNPANDPSWFGWD